MVLALAAYILILLIIADILAIGLEATGLDRRKARFETISLICTVGYSTKQSDSVTNHPIRMNIAIFCMVLGVVNSLALFGFIMNKFTYHLSDKDMYVLIGILMLYFIIIYYRTTFEYMLKHFFMKKGWFNVNTSNVYHLLSSKSGVGLELITLGDNFKYLNMQLKDTDLKELGIQVLNIDKPKGFIKFTEPDNILEKGDTILVYCNKNNLKKAFKDIKGVGGK